MFDVLIIGGGLGGTVAALAAQRRGARVGLATRSWGATAMSTGALDLAFTPALSREHQMPRSLAEHIMDIIAHRRRHPYGVMGLERTMPALKQGSALLSDILEGSGLETSRLDLEAENLLLPSSLGALLPAGGAMAPHRGVTFSEPVTGRWGVLEFRGQPHFDAGRVARGVAVDAESITGTSPELVEMTVPLEVVGTQIEVARALDDQAGADALARELQKKARGLDGIIAPPILGLERTSSVKRRLEEAAGCVVVEALAHMPSVPGIRLQRALERALKKAEVNLVGEIVAVRHDRRRVTAAVTLDDLEISCGAMVLATGRFVSGGVRWSDLSRRCTESLFGLPVVTEDGLMEEDSPHKTLRDTPMESHPLMTAGVQVNADLQPIREGIVPYENLFAAGMVIGGFASRYALCADGVALSTGWLAGCAAAERGSRDA
ncbi:MAG: FAD-binding protein [Myxococcota bacterium]